jgi:hypothetical protein
MSVSTAATNSSMIDRSDRGVFVAELDGDLDDTVDQMALVVFPSSIQVNRLH